jgi:hypothetical protein
VQFSGEEELLSVASLQLFAFCTSFLLCPFQDRGPWALQAKGLNICVRDIDAFSIIKSMRKRLIL